MKQKLVKPLSRFSPRIVILIAVPLIAIGVYMVWFSSAATPGANTSGANVFISSSGNDSGANCTRYSNATSTIPTASTVCKSAAKAYNIAQLGDTVWVLPGSYPKVDVACTSPTVIKDGTACDVTPKTLASNDCRSTNQCIYFIPQPGQQVSAYWDIWDKFDHVVLQGFSSDTSTQSCFEVGQPRTGGAGITQGVNDTYDLTVTNFTGIRKSASGDTGCRYYINGEVSYIRVLNSEFSFLPALPYTNAGGSQIKADSGDGEDSGSAANTPSHILIEGNNVHDYSVDPAAVGSAHEDCLHIFALVDSVVRGNKFDNCYDSSILWNAIDGTNKNENNLIENNWFGPTALGVNNCCFAGAQGTPTVSTTEQFDGYTFRFNTSTGQMFNKGSGEFRNVSFVGNIGLGTGNICTGAVGNPTFSYNLWGSGACPGGTDTGGVTNSQVKLKNIYNGTLDLHLSAGSLAQDKVPQSAGCPSTDIDGELRPQGTACEVGADEFGSTATSLYISPSGNDSNQCTSVAPCLSMNRAYQVASPGDTVIVRAGNYGDQNISWDGTKTAPSITIRADSGATPTLGKMGVETSNLSVIGPFTSKSLETNGSGGNTITNVAVESFTVDGGAKQVIPGYIASANGVTWKNVDISNVREVQAVIVDGGPGGGAQNITFDHLVAHDDFIALGSTNHTECLGLFGGWDITVKNSLFYRCTTFDVFVTWNDTQTGTNNSNRITLENNVFEEPYDSGIPPNDAGPANYAVKWITPDPSPSATRGAIIRNNTFRSLLSLPGSSTNPAPVVTGNIFTGGSCATNTTYRYNVTTSQMCGTGDTVLTSGEISAGYVSPGSHDWSLKSISPAIGKADPTNFPSTDILGYSRPFNTTPDAGAYEYTSTAPPTSTCSTKPGNANTDSVVNIQDIATVLSNYGKTVPTGTTNCADVNNDKIINIQDIAYILGRYGT